jgi:phospholipid/cholesterol/gamma-HCH transport system permease protein
MDDRDAKRPDPGTNARPAGIVEESRRGARLLLGVLIDTLRETARGRREPGEVVRQMYSVGNRSLLFVAVTMGFIAMVGVYQVCLQIDRVTGDLSKVGVEFAKLLVHETSPTITAMMLSTRVGAGIAAEIGSMVVTEQVDALRMCGVNPVAYLVVPRFLACLLMVPVMVVLATCVSLGAGTAMAHFTFGVNPRVFLDLSAVAGGDVATGLAKSLSYGAAIPIVSGYCGLTARGGAVGVGSATTRAVIGSSLAVILLDFVLGVASFLVFHGGVAG